MKSLIAGLSLIMAPAISAASVLELKIESIGWSVTDLDPSDGIAAAAVESPFGAPGDSFASFSHEPVGAGQRIEALSTVGEGMGFRLQPFAPGETVSVSSFSTHSYASPGDAWLRITPNTAVTVTGAVTLQVAGSVDSFSAVAGLGMEIRRPDQQQIVPSPDPATRSSTGPLSITYSNVGSDNVYVLYSYSVDASVTAAPIPEPGSYALMALGLAACALAARRRTTA